MSDQELIHLCLCGGEGLGVSSYDDDSKEVLLSIWRIGRRGYHWRDRLAHMWYFLKRGHPYLDDIVLSRETAQELIDTIQKALDE